VIDKKTAQKLGDPEPIGLEFSDDTFRFDQDYAVLNRTTAALISSAVVNSY
jgi:hypothetical protein